MGATKPQRLDYSPQGGRQFEGLEKSLRSVGDTSIANGRLLEVDITVAAQDVPHGLGKRYSGWFIVEKDAVSDIHTSGGGDKTKYVRLAATVACYAKIWVF